MTNTIQARLNNESLQDILRETAHKPTQHRDVTQLLEQVYYYKNEKYGDSFTDGMEKYGHLCIPIRLNDKLNRIGQLCQGSEDNESLIDNLLDLANYAIMSAMYLTDENCSEETDVALSCTGEIIKEGMTDYTDIMTHINKNEYIVVRVKPYEQIRKLAIKQYDTDEGEVLELPYSFFTHEEREFCNQTLIVPCNMYTQEGITHREGHFFETGTYLILSRLHETVEETLNRTWRGEF